MLNYAYEPPPFGRPIRAREVNRKLKELATVYPLALGIAERLKAADPRLPPLPPRESNAHVGLRQLRTWCATAAKAPAPPPDGNRAAENPHGFLGAADLAKVFHVPPEKMPTLHKRLERFRKRHADDSEYVAAVEEAGPREAHYLHAVKYVLPEIQDLTRPR
jgi:hypothetical protein